MFLPATREEAAARGWDRLDVILVTGDAYIDSPFIGTAVVGRVLLDHGFRVGIIAQPETGSTADIMRLGEPALFWGVTAGCMDSLVSNRTASGRRRRQDDLTPGGKNDRRPDRACIAYTNLIRRACKNTAPVVLGGIEASLRRTAHYDFWSDRLRRSILFDAKADYLVYGMGEMTALRLAQALQNKEDPSGIRGLCYIAKAPKDGFLELPSYEETAADKKTFEAMFHAFYRGGDPHHVRGLTQRHGGRWLIHNPPAPHPTSAELDYAYGLPYERDAHPRCRRGGEIRALETIRFSITTHRGCYAECSFCAIASHQGRRVISRSEDSIVREAEAIARHPAFKGVIADAGGPTANMYGTDCGARPDQALCDDKRCLFPGACKALRRDHARYTELLARLRQIPGVKKVFVASGIRYDLLLEAGESGTRFLKDLAAHHVSGQLKIAPEHCDRRVLALMGKPDGENLERFRRLFAQANKEAGKKQFLTYYFIAAHPGCTIEDMAKLERFTREKLRLRPEQVQIFTPTPSTYSTLMYYTGRDPFTGAEVFVERGAAGKERQKDAVCLPPREKRK
ncbi:MAG: YgiQ family radical SAM protein [Elusimicrobiota bacterium]